MIFVSIKWLDKSTQKKLDVWCLKHLLFVFTEKMMSFLGPSVLFFPAFWRCILFGYLHKWIQMYLHNYAYSRTSDIFQISIMTVFHNSVIPLLGCPRKLGSMVRINGIFHLLINEIYWGEITHFLTIDPNFLGHPSILKRYFFFRRSVHFAKPTVTPRSTSTQLHWVVSWTVGINLCWFFRTAAPGVSVRKIYYMDVSENSGVFPPNHPF